MNSTLFDSIAKHTLNNSKNKYQKEKLFIKKKVRIKIMNLNVYIIEINILIIIIYFRDLLEEIKT
jgi:hypothetical protein